MNTLHLTDNELAVVRQAVESFNDMSNDMVFDDLSINLFPRGVDHTTINSAQAKELRDELSQALRDRETVITLMTKIGSTLNANGYSA